MVDSQSARFRTRRDRTLVLFYATSFDEQSKGFEAFGSDFPFP
jgi:hypothetical protein